MEYRIFIKSYPEDLSSEIEQAIKQGWKPIGGVSVTPDECFCQAMVRDVKPGLEKEDMIMGQLFVENKRGPLYRLFNRVRNYFTNATDADMRAG